MSYLKLLLPVYLLVQLTVLGQTVLLDATFDGVANGTNETFAILSNTPAATSGATWDPATGIVNRGSNANSTAGAVSSTTIDVASIGTAPLVYKIEVTAASGNPSANGAFFGLQQGADGVDVGDNLWNNQGPAFGLVIDGGSRLGVRQVGPGGNAGSGGFQVGPEFGVVTGASFNDGFEVEITIANFGWSIVIDGLETSTGDPIVGGSGSWDSLPIDFSQFTSNMRAAFTFQGSGGGTLEVQGVEVFLDGDTDNDGMPDRYEDANGLSKTNALDAAFDMDAVGGADGLTNLEEYLAGTDPQDSDTDDDTLSDGDELDGTLNPWANGVLGTPPGDATNPLRADTDMDGDDDALEITNGTDPNRAPPNTGPLFPFVDSDGDGYRDVAEIAFGSNPTNAAVCPDHTPTVAKPNVVIIYADDMGFGDMSGYGKIFGTPSPAVTPRMDGLAAQGVLFTQAHSANGVCTPSRYSLLTGKYNWRSFDGISGHYGHANIPEASDVTIAEFLKVHGYDTAAFGKWHLGGSWYLTNSNTRVSGNPNTPAAIDWARRVDHHAVDHGFDIFRGLATTINFGPYVFIEDDRNQFWDMSLNGGTGAFRNATNADPFEWFTTGELNSSVVGAKDSRASLGDPSYRQVDAGPIMIGQVEQYFADRVSSGDTDPFMAYVSLYSPHKPWALTASFVGTNSASGFHYADWMPEVDDRIGRVIDAIDNNGFFSNTVVVITSDNGPENTAMSQSIANGRDPNGPLRGNKRDVWDGGTRVPFVIRWPGQAAPGMVVSDLIWQGDIFATVAAYLGVELADNEAPDGESFLNIIRGQRKPQPQRAGIVVSSIRRDLALKTVDGWKLIDATGGGNNISWDSSDDPIPAATGVNRGAPKQLFHQAIDLGEDINLIASLTDEGAIRSELTNLTGSDLLGLLDQLRTNTTAQLFTRVPDNDGDTIPNAYEIAEGLDPNSPKDAEEDRDEDGASNRDEFVAGTDGNNPMDRLHIVDPQSTADEFTIRWPSVLGRMYDVSWSLDTETWTVYGSEAGTGAELSMVLSEAIIDAADGSIGNLTRVYLRVAVR